VRRRQLRTVYPSPPILVSVGKKGVAEIWPVSVGSKEVSAFLRFAGGEVGWVAGPGGGVALAEEAQGRPTLVLNCHGPW
jgi:hypothetical protein